MRAFAVPAALILGVVLCFVFRSPRVMHKARPGERVSTMLCEARFVCPEIEEQERTHAWADWPFI
jgi:hypothetical protein